MHTLFALVLTATAAVVIARPPGPVAVATTVSHDDAAHSMPTRKYLKDYLLPRYLWPHYFAYDESPRVPQPLLQPDPEAPKLAADWLNQEIERLSRMQQRAANRFQSENSRRVPDPVLMKRMLVSSPYDGRNHMQLYYANQPWPAWSMVTEESAQQHAHNSNENSNDIYGNAHESHEIAEQSNRPVTEPISKEGKKKEFALTPLDDGYFEPTEKLEIVANMKPEEGQHEGGGEQIQLENKEPVRHPELEPEPPRPIRQNPNLSRAKTLVSENLDILRTGLSGHEEVHQRDSQRIHPSVMESAAPDSAESFYGVALISAIGAAVVLAVVGFALGWYTLSKRAKAAADVDYPAYGVTGPTMDTSGDRKLAHSAHMYHYQHQKQQIIAMENSGMEQRNSSVSDPESEDENEEGDYTVYECPGFATTGDMEVKNPLFNEDPTPATPGKCEVVKPQPKD